MQKCWRRDAHLSGYPQTGLAPLGATARLNLETLHQFLLFFFFFFFYIFFKKKHDPVLSWAILPFAGGKTDRWIFFIICECVCSQGGSRLAGRGPFRIKLLLPGFVAISVKWLLQMLDGSTRWFILAFSLNDAHQCLFRFYTHLIQLNFYPLRNLTFAPHEIFTVNVTRRKSPRNGKGSM